MSDDAKFARIIRISTIGGSLMLGLVVLTGLLMLAGVLPSDGSAIVQLVFGLVLASLSFLTVRSARQDRADPAGIERRFEQSAVVFSAFLIVAAIATVVGIIVWGVLG